VETDGRLVVVACSSELNCAALFELLLNIATEYGLAFGDRQLAANTDKLISAWLLNRNSCAPMLAAFCANSYTDVLILFKTKSEEVNL